MKKGRFFLSILTIFVVASQAFAQLGDKDITTLRQRAAKEGWTFQVGRNPATERPMNQLCGLVEPANWRATARFASSPMSVVPPSMGLGLPASFDWRTNGLPPIRDQGSCGSCWAFSTVGALECNIKLKDGVTTDLSEQWLVSCNQSSWGCGGGWFAHDYHLRSGGSTDPYGGNGAVFEADKPYTAADSSCNGPYTHRYWIDSWAYIGTDSTVPAVSAIKQAIMTYGPVSVGIYVNDAFQAYAGGVFNQSEDKSINHAVVLVGWDDNQGSNGVWFLRNSWGAGWGESGYMRIGYGVCRVGYAACYVDYRASSGLQVTPSSGLSCSGPQGGSFTPASQDYELRNSGSGTLNWTVTHTQTWVSATPTSGTLAAGKTTNVTVSIGAGANSLNSGAYVDTVTFSNRTDGKTQARSVNLRVGQVDYFTELFDTTANDLDNLSFTFTPNASPSGYAVQRAVVSSFATNPAGGTTLTLTDDGNQLVTIGGGNRVSLYGTSYSSFYVNANGNITFASADSAYDETLAAHFGRARISGLFDDLNPSAGGTVSWKQYADRVIVTFQNVPEYNQSNQNTFQFELFFNGVIRLTFLGVAATDGLVGLSAGAGLPADFVESDFSAYTADPVQVGSLRAMIAPAGAVSAGAQWRVDGGNWQNSGTTVTNLSVGSHTVDHKDVSGYSKPADAAVSISAGATTVVTGTYTVAASTLGDALDAPELVWTTGGNAGWLAESSVTHDLTDAGQSGSIADAQQSWLQATVQGPGTLNFWWKASSEATYDFLRFYVDGVEQSGSISGEQDWQQRTFSIAAGSHVLKWAYTKDNYTSSGLDAAWVDQVNYAPQTNVNIALASRGSTITGNSGANWGALIDGQFSLSNYGVSYWPSGTMTLDLKAISIINSIRLRLWDGDNRYYRYKMEYSENGSTWLPLVDRTSGEWRSWQDLPVSPSIQARYLKLTGTYGSYNTKFGVVEWEVYGQKQVSVVTTATSMTVPEGGTGTFTVKLSIQPAATVTVAVQRVSGDADITVQAGSSLVFTPANWNSAQTVRLAAAEDPDQVDSDAVVRLSGTGVVGCDIPAREADNDRINLARASRGSTITGSNGSGWGALIDGQYSLSNYGVTYWPSGTMTLDLKALYSINNIRLLLWNGDSRYYRYMIEGSTNNVTWTTIVDRTAGEWRGWQELPLSPDVQARYLRLTGTYGSYNTKFSVAEWEVYGGVTSAGAPLAPSAGGLVGILQPFDVLSSGGAADHSNAVRAVDGKPGTSWSGMPAAGGCWLALTYDNVVEVSDVQIDFAEGSSTSVLLRSSTDAKDWVDLESAWQNGPASLQYLWLIFPDDGSTNPRPVVQEIRVKSQ